MSDPDNLRDRIAAAMDPIVDPPCCDECKAPSLSMREAVEAVIEDLGLKREDYRCSICSEPHRGHRYVTEWTTDE